MSEEVSEECNYITALHQIHHITSNENSLMVNTDHPCNIYGIAEHIHHSAKNQQAHLHI